MFCINNRISKIPKQNNKYSYWVRRFNILWNTILSNSKRYLISLLHEALTTKLQEAQKSFFFGSEFGDFLSVGYVFYLGFEASLLRDFKTLYGLIRLRHRIYCLRCYV